MLTMFGIIWGTVAITVLVAFGMGFKRQMSVNMHGIGESIGIMWPGRTTKPWQGFGTGRSLSFTEEDLKLITSQVQEVRRVSPEYSRRTTARVGENILNPLVTGVHPGYEEMRNIIPMPGGRFINDQDNEHRRRVIFIGDKVKEFLFGQTDAVGRVVMVGVTPFTVIGVMEKKTQPSSYNSRDQDRVFVPSTTYQSTFGQVYLSNIIYQVRDPRRGEETAKEVRAALSKRYKFDPLDEDAVWIWDTTEFDNFIFYFFLGLNIFLGMIGSFTLGVAGIGLANIMFIVVQERIKEIGVKRAVGATRRDIMAQFFLETSFILGLGAGIGFLVSAGIIAVLQMVPIKEYVGVPELSGTVLAVTMSVLTAIGLAAGLFPAKRAANANVVDCLRT
jgi:putative ABC transport system permease protein